MARMIVSEFSYALSPERRVELRMAFYITRGSISTSDAEYIDKALARYQRSKPIHGLVLVFGGTVDEDAKVLLDRVERKYLVKILTIPLTRIIDRIQLAAIGRAIWESVEDPRLAMEAAAKQGVDVARDLLDLNEARAKLRELWDSIAIDNVLNSIAVKPVVVEDIKLVDPLAKYKDLVDVMKWLATIPSSHAKVSEVFKHVIENVMRFHLFGTKKGVLAHDIESVDKLRGFIKALHQNEVLIYDEANDVVDISKLSPYEARIVDIVTKVFGGIAPESIVKEFFIPASPNFDKIWSTYLQLLELRGVVCYGSSDNIEQKFGISTGYPGKERLIVVLDRDKAKMLIDRWINEIENVVSKDRDLAKHIGYIVSCKERGCRYFKVEELFDLVLDMASKARKMLEFSHRDSVRIARIARELIEYYNTNVRPLLLEADDVMKKLIREMKTLVKDYRDTLESIKKLVNEYIATKPIDIKVKLVEDLEKACHSIEDIYNMEIDLNNMIRDSKNVVESEKESPFYFRGKGPLYRFNYKLWLVYRTVNRFIDLDSWSIRRDIAEDLDKLRNFVEEIKRAIESIQSMKSCGEQLNEVLKSLSLDPKVVEVLKNLKISKIELKNIDVNTVDELIHSLRASMQRWLEQVVDMSRKLEEMKIVLKDIEELEQRTLSKIKEVVDFAELSKNIMSRCGRGLISNRCRDEAEEALRKIEELAGRLLIHKDFKVKRLELGEVLEHLKKFREELLAVDSELSKIDLKTCKEAVEELRRTIVNTVKGIEMLYRITAIESSVRSRLEELYKEALDIANRDDISSICVRIERIEDLHRKAREVIVSSGMLTDEEVDVYVELLKIKEQNSGYIRLWEVVEAISNRLLMDKARVKRVLLNLIERDLIDVYV